MTIGKHGRIALLAALVSAAIAAACYGTVFLRHGGGWAEESVAYTSTVGINGQKAQLQVSGTGSDFDTMIQTLRGTAFAGREKQLAVGDGMAFGLFRENDRIVRVLVTMLDGKCVLFRIDQSPEEFELYLRANTSSRLKSLPSYPDSVPVFSADNEASGTAIEVSRAGSDPGTVWGVIDAGMKKDGWASTAGASHPLGVDGTGMGVYVRGGEVCCVQVSGRAGSGSESTVSFLLHKGNTGTETTE